jgi:transposase
MPQPGEDDQNSSHAEEIILGVDTHKDVHVAAVITSLGALRETTTFPATAAGYQALLAWAGTFGVLRRAGGEGTGSYGAALARHLRAADIEVIGVNQPDKAARRRQGKTDALDAQAAARAVLSGQRAGPLLQLAHCGRGDRYPHRRYRLPGGVDRHRGQRALVWVDPNGDHASPSVAGQG